MKEILYIQAGSQANYIGTHFWNTQESYFTYGDDEDPETCHSISFREGLNSKSEPTFCPRLLAFDHKSNFGTLSQANALFGMGDTANEQILWTEDPVEYKQEPVRKSRYQADMEELDLDYGDTSDAQLDDVRYWSDFNRLFYVPRTVQKIPDVPEWEDAEGNWTAGHETFTRFDEDTGLMEGPFRLFLEECETIQGIQIIHDASTFGGFIDSFLTSLRDDFVKLPLLVWPLLSDAPLSNTADDRRGTRKAINDALVLRSLSELSSMNIPIQSSTTWADEVCTNTYMHASKAHVYHTSAILSAHIETVTLPLRLYNAKEDIQSFVGQLSWRTALPFTELSGAFPHAGTIELDRGVYSFSSAASGPWHPIHFGRRDVTRGFSRSGITSYNEWINRSGIDDSLISSTHAAAYPLPTSFPNFFGTAMPQNGPSGILSRPRSTSVFSSIGASSETADLFSRYATFLEDCARRKISVERAGIDVDEMGDMANDMWTFHDNAGGGTDGNSDEDVRGEDED
ncbi:mtDNA inheritance protein Dml1 [Mycena maculata]|uniref:MtDNA inheritance protein Dml1 n=1 Tax=Mycena maculata TaxID=230809 RepID=A0AAD7K282_9AGAR|nr:mtDNA inheritance protein Dml1 [Mycena maculata]